MSERGWPRKTRDKAQVKPIKDKKGGSASVSYGKDYTDKKEHHEQLHASKSEHFDEILKEKDSKNDSGRKEWTCRFLELTKHTV